MCLPNFGDEKGVADTLKLAGLNVPVLVQAYPDDLDQLHVERRRDAFCGKISVCNNLRQYGIPFRLTERHTVHRCVGRVPRRPADSSSRVCRVVSGLRRRAHRRHRRAARTRSTPRATARSCWRRPASASARSTSPRCSTARAGSRDDDPRVKQKLAEISGYAARAGRAERRRSC